MMTTHSFTENIDDCTLHYLKIGGDKARPVVLLHGMKFTAETWRELETMDELAQAGFTAIALEMPGFGESSECKLDRNTVLQRFLSQAEINKPVLVGPSMGGQISLEFAIEHPELLSGLVLIGAVGVPENQDKLDRITVPTLILWGEEDSIAPPENSKILANGIKNSHCIVFDGAPHPCYLDQPERWHSSLLDFLAALKD